MPSGAVNFWATRANNCKIYCSKQGSSVTFTRIINTVKAGYHSDDRLRLLAHHASLTWNGPVWDHPSKTLAFLRGGVKNLPNLPADSSKKNCRQRGKGLKNREKLPTSSMDGPFLAQKECVAVSVVQSV